MSPDVDLLPKLETLGAGALRHVNGPLLSHLKGTRDLLRKWGNPEALCNAGLYHAVYGTAGFEPALLDVKDRGAGAALLGEDAERIVYVFAACDREYFYKQLLKPEEPAYRDRFTGAIYRLNPEAFRDICELTLANELEILAAAPGPNRSCGRHLDRVLGRMTAHASQGAREDYRRLIERP